MPVLSLVEEKTPKEHLFLERNNNMDLVIEITRRCNLKCAHCMRGSVQRKDLNTNLLGWIEWLYEEMGEPWVSLTGGEPFLKPDILRKVVSSIGYSASFYMVTNGRTNNPTAIRELLTHWRGLVNDEFVIKVSSDRYHRDSPPYKKVHPVWNEDEWSPITVDICEGTNPWVITEGRAEGMYGKGPEKRDCVYVTVDGDIMLDYCDLSYKHIKQKTIGNITDFLVRDKITKYIKRKAK